MMAAMDEAPIFVLRMAISPGNAAGASVRGLDEDRTDPRRHQHRQLLHILSAIASVMQRRRHEAR
jgi:hypothetical protein